MIGAGGGQQTYLLHEKETDYVMKIMSSYETLKCLGGGGAKGQYTCLGGAVDTKEFVYLGPFIRILMHHIVLATTTTGDMLQLVWEGGVGHKMMALP